MSKMPLYNSILKYSENIKGIFHMPGHKQNKGILEKYMRNSLALDVTEVLETDYLHDAKGVILEAEKLAAKTFKADITKFLVNGSTCGIEAMIMTLCKPGEEILVARNCHKSIYSGLILSGAVPVFIEPEIIHGFCTAGEITKEKVEEALKNHPNVKGLILSNPTYEGFCSDIKGIAKILHEKDKILLVDEAHGAHFGFHEKFPKSSIQLGADIVVQSSHKMLPALTQTAMIHISSRRVNVNRLLEILSITQSSSPSYILMSMLDVCRFIMENEGYGMLESLYTNTMDFHTKMKTLKKIKSFYMDKEKKEGIFQMDLGKLILYSDFITGKELEQKLKREYKIQMEMSKEKYTLGIVTLCDGKENFDYLFESLKKIDGEISYKKEKRKVSLDILLKGKVMISPREAFYSEKKEISLEESINKIVAEFIIPYPPGIPLLVPGEEISIETVKKIKELLHQGYRILGSNIENQKIQVVR